MKMLSTLMMVGAVAGALTAMGASDMRSANEPTTVAATNAWGAATNAPATNTMSSAWRRSATEAKEAGNRAADVTGDTLHKAGDATKDAVKDAGNALERTGEKMQ